MTEQTKKTEKPKKQVDAKSAKVNVAKTARAAKPKIDKVVKPKKVEAKNVITEVRASAKFIRIAPRKVRLVVKPLNGYNVDDALAQLKFIVKAASRDVTKLINSAIANAENNFNLDRKDLYIKSLVVNDGPTLKRYRPRAHGRSAAIRKRTSHIDLILGVAAGAKLVAKPAAKPAAKKEEIKVVNPDEVAKSGPKSGGPKAPSEQGHDSQGFLKGIFQRKTG
jgi:large subunit ribosomal protein L22